MATSEAAFDLSQAFAAVRRRRLPAALTFVALALGSMLLALLWPPSYSATGTILIEQQELPTDLVRSTVSTYASQRVQIITQRVMTAENLMGIIERFKLYPDMRGRKPREEIIATMRRAVNLQMISADVIDPREGRPTKATIAFSLTYSNRSPQLAEQVANELVSLYLQQNIEQRQKSSHDAVAFLSGERVRLTTDMDALQAKLAAFKAKHENELPELSQVNLANVARTEGEIRDGQTRSQILEQQVLYLDAQLAQINPAAQIYSSTGERVQSPADLLKALRSEYTKATALYSPDHPDVQRLKREIEAMEAKQGIDTAATSAAALEDLKRQLEDAQAKLADASHRYAADHPDVVRYRKLVDSLQQQVAAAAVANNTATDSTGAVTHPQSVPQAQPDSAADNPPYIQLRTQREAALNEIKALADRGAVLQKKLNDYEERLARTPGVEREYSEILRELSSAQNQYAEIRRRQMEADVSDNLEIERKGERFTLIEPPLSPEAPTSPNRPLILLLGTVAAIAAALALIAILEGLDGSVRNRRDLAQLLPVPPLAIIPVMLTSADHRLRARRRVFALYGAAGCLFIALITIHFLYRPLDVIWAVALRRLGV